jgi:hypothetical protein
MAVGAVFASSEPSSLPGRTTDESRDHRASRAEGYDTALSGLFLADSAAVIKENLTVRPVVAPCDRST